jgi:CYTH domain-containing protein
MIERERRFLVATLPPSLPPGSPIEQGYLTTDPVSVRVRRQENRFTLTIKTGSGLARTEIERDLSADEFDALWAVADDLRIEKRRHRVPVGDGHVAELDLFDGALAGRRIVEVEFDSDDAARAFEPPEWFGREVTEDRRFTNSSLARKGWPED